MSRAPDDLEAFRAAFWVGMRRAAADPKAPSRFCALATVAEDGGAEARTVVLRAADPAAAAVEAFTDARTPKLREIAAEPRVTLLYWDPRARLQGRVRGRARAETGPAAAARLRALPEAARRDYAAAAAPGSALSAPGAAALGEAVHFATLRLEATEIDLLALGRDGHRRALYRRADGWRGAWLQP